MVAVKSVYEKLLISIARSHDNDKQTLAVAAEWQDKSYRQIPCVKVLICGSIYDVSSEKNKVWALKTILLTTINSLVIDISSIDIPDDFFRNSRIPSVEEYSGPPPYLQLFNPKVKAGETKREESKTEDAKPCVSEALPPQYKMLFSDGPPCYHEVVQTTVCSWDLL